MTYPCCLTHSSKHILTLRFASLFFLIVLTVLSIYPSSSVTAKTLVKRANITDMVLIYSGGDHRKVEWNITNFSDYVATNVSGKPQWLFDGFLFLEIFWTQEVGLATGYRNRGATKEDWITLIDKYLSPGRDLVALNETVGKFRSQIAGKFERRKIVLSLPEPLYGQTDWGEIDGRKLDFHLDKDRLAACCWYIDLLKTKFKQAGLDNLQLCGFYWLAEHATETRSFVHSVSDYIHASKLDFYWIPYFKADGYQNWKELGFDHAYLQPNHFFEKDIPDTRIDEACTLAQQHNLSLEMEFDERASESQGWGNRLKAYIDSYERNNIFVHNPIAYYQGDNAFSLLKHGSEADRALYTRLAKIIAKRQQQRLH